jgi:hypothetical protein
MEKEIAGLGARLREYKDDESKTIELKDSQVDSLVINIDEINTENHMMYNETFRAEEDVYTDEVQSVTSKTISEDDLNFVHQENIIQNTYILESQGSYYDEHARLNVDLMTYEQLLELQEQIGYVSKGFSLPELEVS